MTIDEFGNTKCPFCGDSVDQMGVYGIGKKRQVTYGCGRYATLLDGKYDAGEFDNCYIGCLRNQLRSALSRLNEQPASEPEKPRRMQACKYGGDPRCGSCPCRVEHDEAGTCNDDYCPPCVPVAAAEPGVCRWTRFVANGEIGYWTCGPVQDVPMDVCPGCGRRVEVGKC